jgi:quinol monooxygenase YgiN
MAAMIAASRDEAGCLGYGYAEDVLEPGLIHVTERWTDRAALDAHVATAHLAAWRAQWAVLGLHSRDLAIYHVAKIEDF